MTGAFKDAKEKSLFCAQAALEKKAFNITILELKEVSAVTDYFLICSGKSDRQVQAIAQAVEETLEREGLRVLGQEGKAEGRWVLMDSGDVVIHIFLEPIRAFYDLEGLWVDATRIDPEKGERLGESSLSKEKRAE